MYMEIGIYDAVKARSLDAKCNKLSKRFEIIEEEYTSDALQSVFHFYPDELAIKVNSINELTLLDDLNVAQHLDELGRINLSVSAMPVYQMGDQYFAKRQG